jgi:hypothetical protein
MWIGTYQVVSQELVTSTPVRINVPSEVPPVIDVVITPTATWTPTPSAVLIEVKEGAGDVNVRADADVESELLGTIRAGEFYPVLGRYFRWIQFQFDSAPTGRGWVFDELVNIVGDPSTIPDLSQGPLPTSDPIIEAATQTQAAITSTPGGILTLTAESRILPVPGQVENGDVPGEAPSGTFRDDAPNILPTFTYPPDVVVVAPTEVETLQTATSPEPTPLTVPDQLPPIVPILLLGGAGLFGLVVSALRR